MNTPVEAIPKEIEISELRRAIDMIFDHIETDMKLKTIKLNHDYYANLGLQEKFEIQPSSDKDVFLKNPDIGQLYEDWAFLENMMEANSPAALMFEHVAPILRYIGYKALEQARREKDT